MSGFSTRIGDNWLVLTHLRGSTWRLQVWGDTPLEAGYCRRRSRSKEQRD
jgi:hypothetical protein